jgi:hypothetical protein
MSPTELAEAAILETGLDYIDAETRLTEPLDILEICGSLITYDEVWDEVRLAHHSVRDYLSEHVLIGSPFSLPESKAHFEVARACLCYLLLQEFSSGWCATSEMDDRMDRYPLLHYAAEHWAFHVINSNAEQDLQPLILRLMGPLRTPHFLFWIQIILRPDFGLARRTAQPLYYAASYGLTETVRSLVRAGARLDDEAGRFGGTALHAACYRQHPDIARFLLEAGADYTIQDVNGATALNLCEWIGDQEMAQLFQKTRQVRDDRLPIRELDTEHVVT